MISLIWGNLKYNVNEPIYKTETHRQREQTCSCKKRDVGRGNDGLGICKLLYIEWINNKVPLIAQETIFNICDKI